MGLLIAILVFCLLAFIFNALGKWCKKTAKEMEGVDRKQEEYRQNIMDQLKSINRNTNSNPEAIKSRIELLVDRNKEIAEGNKVREAMSKELGIK